MKVNSTVLTNSLPDVRFNDGVVRVDIGPIIIEMSPLEAASLLINLLAVVPVRELVPGAFK